MTYLPRAETPESLDYSPHCADVPRAIMRGTAMSLEHSPIRFGRDGGSLLGRNSGSLTLEDDRIYRAPEASVFLNRFESSLAKDRIYGRGCPFIRSGRSVGYLGADIRATREANRRRSTSEVGTVA